MHEQTPIGRAPADEPRHVPQSEPKRQPEPGRQPEPPSGRQHEICWGEHSATIVEVGAGIREYSHAGVPVLEAYPLQEICDGGHGAPLIPWPNRLAGGRYSFDGAERQLDLSEPSRGNAIHGLLRWRSWSAADARAASVVMRTRLAPSPGYPFSLEVRIAYELGEGGLTVATTALNTGAHACPYGAGQHPYLSPGTGLLDACTLTLQASTRLIADQQSQVPVGREPVPAELDFSSARRIGDQVIDTAFTGLARDGEGIARALLGRADGSCVELWADSHHGYLQVFTGDTLAAGRRRTGLAVEPMTCPANAFRSGESLIRLEPGEMITTRWGVRPLPAG